MEISALIQSAFHNYQSGNIPQAESLCRQILDIQPDNSDILNLLGAILSYHRVRHDEAILCYQRSLQANPNQARTYINLGIGFYSIKKSDEALSCFRKSLQLNPDADAYCYAGQILKETGNLDEAINYFRMAVGADPASAWAFTNLGDALHNQGQFTEAETCFQKARELNPNLRNPDYAALGNMLLSGSGGPEELPSFEKNGPQSILIIVNAFNRKKITQLSLGQTMRYKTSSCRLQVYNDHSDEYDNAFLSEYCDEVILLPVRMGLENLRWHQFRKFMETDFDFLYITDNDVIHDPGYIPLLYSSYRAGNRKLPVSLYNSIFTMQPRMILVYKEGLFLKTTAPGCSMFFDRKMVQQIVAMLGRPDENVDNLPWDNKVSAYLNLPWITPEISYVDHYGAGGINNVTYERDRAVNPSHYLYERRSSIVQYLVGETELEIDFF